MAEDRFQLDRHFESFEEMASAVMAWDIDFYQLSESRYENHVTQLATPRTILSRSRHGCVSALMGTTPSGYRTFAFLDDRSPPIKFENTFAPQKTLMCFPEDNAIDSSAPENFDVFTLSIAHEYLYKKMDSYINVEPEDLLKPYGIVLNCPSDKMNQLSELYRHTMNCLTSYQACPEFLAILLDRLSYEEQLTELVIENLLAGHHIDKSYITNKSYTSIKKTLDIITELDSCELNVGEISRMIGSSRSSLEGAFKKYYQVTPKRFIKYTRLNRVRNELLAPDSGEKIISEIAFRHGFWHMSQFAQDYRYLFGELPSTTVRKAARYRH